MSKNLESKLLSKSKTKELERRYGNLAKNLVGYQDHIDFRFFDDFNDDAFAFLMKNVKAVNMLDLNETDITNESIKLLPNLEYVNELRAKQCRNLTDDCIEDLNKLTTLTFLHLKSTEITIDALLKLKNLANLKTLMFSEDDISSIKEKLIQLKLMLLPCEIVIDSKPYFYNSVELFIRFLKDKSFLYKLKLKNLESEGNWSKFLSKTKEHFIEAELQGNFSLEDIEWIEIKNLENEDDLQSFQFEELQNLLNYLEFPFVIENEIISLYILENEIY